MTSSKTLYTMDNEEGVMVVHTLPQFYDDCYLIKIGFFFNFAT